MESKYLQRAIELLDEDMDWKLWSNRFVESSEAILEAMCKLAEEVEKDTIQSCFDMTTWFSKEQVEELLQKQRELCAKKAKMTGIAYGNDKYISDYEVDKDSILNVKLKLE